MTGQLTHLFRCVCVCMCVHICTCIYFLLACAHMLDVKSMQIAWTLQRSFLSTEISARIGKAILLRESNTNKELNRRGRLQRK